MLLNIKRINKLNQWENGSVDVTFKRATTHQKHHAQCVKHTLGVFTNEPIREQEIRWECMNKLLILEAQL